MRVLFLVHVTVEGFLQCRSVEDTYLLSTGVYIQILVSGLLRIYYLYSQRQSYEVKSILQKTKQNLRTAS